MLTLNGARVIAGYTVYHDDQNEIEAVNHHIDAVLRGDPIAHPDAATGTPGRATTPPAVKHFYVLPKDPQIAHDAGGKPIFSLILYRKQAATLDPDKVPRSGDAGGGILTFTVELAVPDADFNTIKGQLRAAVFGDDASNDPSQDIDLQYVDFIDGKVTVAVEGENTADDGTKREFVVSAIGSGKISGVGDNRKAIMVKLTQDGATLMADSKKLTTLPINVSYELTYEYRLLGVTMHVWCDVTSSFHLLQEVFHEEHEEDSGYLGTSDNQVRTDKVTSVTQLFVSNKTAGVEVIPESSSIDADTITSMEKEGMDILTKQLEKVQDAAPPPATMDVTYLTKYYSDVSSQLNMTVDRRMVLTRLYTPSANISNVFKGARLDELVAYVELDNAFYALLTVPIRVNADFTKLPISSVVVTLTYQSMKMDQSGPEERTSSFSFTDGQTIQTFVAYANSLDTVKYAMRAEVHYTDSQEPYTFSRDDVSERFLVVDVGTLGLISVDLLVGLVVFDDFPECKVSLRYQRRSGGLPVEKSFTLTKDKQTALWTDIIKEESTGAYEYKVDWLRKSDGAILPGAWAPSTALRLVVDAPVPARFDITGVCVGNFKDGTDQLSTVLLALRYSDPANNYLQEKQLQFLQDGQLLTWTVDLRNPMLRDYQYRFSKIYKGGVVKNMPPDNPDGTPAWLAGPPGFITVGEHYFLNVSLYPFLLGFGEREKVVQVDLTYANADHDVNITNSFVFNKDNNQTKVWRIQGDDGWPRNYSVAVSYFSSTGEVVRVPAVAGAGDTFVIPPAPAPKTP